MSLIKNKIKNFIQTFESAKSIILTTHKICDGDGLGSLLSFYHAFCTTKKIQAFTIGDVYNKYDILSPKKYTQNFTPSTSVMNADLGLVFDTNDSQRIQPLYEQLKKKCKQIIYIDHHPISGSNPLPPDNSLIDTSIASTGELCYFILKQMGVKITPSIATALYVSILCDTQRFKFIRNSASSYQICAEIFPFIKENEYIYNQLFESTSLKKMQFMAQVITNTSYVSDNTIAILEIPLKNLQKYELNIGDSCDFLDIIVNLQPVQYAALIIPLSKNNYKLSFRSNKKSILHIAEAFGGGGHHKFAGANIENYKNNPKTEIIKLLNLM